MTHVKHSLLPMGKAWSLDFQSFSFVCILDNCLNHPQPTFPPFAPKKTLKLRRCRWLLGESSNLVLMDSRFRWECLLMLQHNYDMGVFSQNSIAKLVESFCSSSGKFHFLTRKNSILAIGSMYGIYTYIYHKHQPFM